MKANYIIYAGNMANEAIFFTVEFNSGAKTFVFEHVHHGLTPIFNKNSRASRTW